MKVLKSLRVERPNRQPGRLWGSVQRLIVVVTECEGFEGSVIAYGVDPEHTDAARDKPIFEEWMRSTQLDAFLARLQQGDAPWATGTLRTMPVVDAATVNALPVDDSGTIDYPSPRPPTTGPKLQRIFSYAHTLIAAGATSLDGVAISRTSTGDAS